MLFSLTLPSQAQKSSFGVPNLQKYDNQLFHFGFLLGYNQFDFAIRSDNDLSQYDSLMVINTAAMSGFNLGIVTNLRLGKYFDLRFIPGLSFGDRVVRYTILYPDASQLITKKRIESVYLDLPLLVKFKSSRMHNVRAYVIAGAQYSLDLISAAKKKNSNPNEIMLKLYPHDVQAQVGVGIDFYCTYFKFTTECSLIYFIISVTTGDPISKLGYKKGILLGLVVAACGCAMFYPASTAHSYPLFLGGLFVIGLGVTVLQIAANPYVTISISGNCL